MEMTYGVYLLRLDWQLRHCLLAMSSIYTYDICLFEITILQLVLLNDIFHKSANSYRSWAFSIVKRRFTNQGRTTICHTNDNVTIL